LGSILEKDIQGVSRHWTHENLAKSQSLIKSGVQFMFIKGLGLSQIFQVSSVARHPVGQKVVLGIP